MLVNDLAKFSALLNQFKKGRLLNDEKGHIKTRQITINLSRGKIYVAKFITPVNDAGLGSYFLLKI